MYHLFIVRSKQRDALRAHLERHGVSTAVHYPFPIHRTEAYGSQPEGSLPVAERLAEEICTLPLFPTMSDARSRARDRRRRVLRRRRVAPLQLPLAETPRIVAIRGVRLSEEALPPRRYLDDRVHPPAADPDRTDAPTR